MRRQPRFHAARRVRGCRHMSMESGVYLHEMHEMRLAERMSRIATESAFEVLVRARSLEAAGHDIIHLEIGEPDFATPRHIVEAAKQALDDGWTQYGPPQGLPELREAIAAEVCRARL